jgi:hypothetical protein
MQRSRGSCLVFLLAVFLAVLGGSACGAGGGAPGKGEPGGRTVDLPIAVPPTGRVYVNLRAPGVVVPAGEPQTSHDWDLAFEGYELFTNSGPSGAGKGGAFGPLSRDEFLSNATPEVPFLQPDKTGGALLDWYAYDGAAHVLYSRFHVYGVKTAEKVWKFQVLAYYGERSNAPVGALYRVRYAGLEAPASEGVRELEVDGTAGGVQAAATAPSGCLDLATGTVKMLTVTDAQASVDWDLCFRRDAISVNGEAGGPGDVGAVDLQADLTAGETTDEVSLRTPESEQATFDVVTPSSLAAATFRGDHVVSAFERGRWLDTTTAPPRPRDAAWLVVDASGQHKFLISFLFEQSTASSPGTVVLHIKPVGE